MLYFISALGSALSNDPVFFAIMRLPGVLESAYHQSQTGLHIEIAPAQYRGRLVALYQFQIVFGILIAFLSNYIISEFFMLDWRWMLGIEAIPALVFVMMTMTVPESPRWLLLRRNDENECRRILDIIDSSKTEETILSIKRTQNLVKDNLFVKQLSMPIFLAFFIAFFNQLSGINFIIYFAPRVFSQV